MRIVTFGVLSACAALCASAAVAQSTQQVCYVLIEKQGLEVYCGLYADEAEMKERGQIVIAENDNRTRTNDATDKTIKDLHNQIASKKRDLNEADKKGDADAKATLEREIATLEEQIRGEEAKRVDLIKLIGPRKFRTLKAAEDYIEKIYDESDAAKEELRQKEHDEEQRKKAEAEKKADK